MGLLDDLTNNPQSLGLLTAGLNILANNGRMSGGQAIGNGLLGGLQGMQQAQMLSQRKLQHDQELAMQKAQQEMQTKRFNMEQAKFDNEQKQQADIEAAIAEQSRLHPELAGAFRIDPKLAFKAAYPSLNANGADPYYTPIATENGLGSFDNRSGKFIPLNINGKPIIKSTDSPTLQGKISASKSYGENLYQPTDMKSGTIKSKSQLAIDAGSPSPSAGFPKIDKGTQRQRDLTALDMKLAEQNDIGGVGKNPALDREIANDKMRLGISNSQSAGIRVPTKAEEAAAIEKAKADVNLETDKTKNVKTADKFISVAKQAESLLKQDPTGSGIGSLADSAGRIVGLSTKSGQAASQLEAVSGWLVSNVPRMEGPQSNYDVENYRTMAGKVGDRTVPVAERKAALTEVIRLQQKYKELNGGNSQPEQPKTRSKADILKQYGVR